MRPWPSGSIPKRGQVGLTVLTFAVPVTKFCRMVEHMDESFLITPSRSKVRQRIAC